MKINYIALPFAAILTLTSSLSYAKAGEKSGSYKIDKTGTVFSIGGSNTGGKMWADGYVYAEHNKKSSYQRTRSNLDLQASFLKKKVKIIDSEAQVKHWREPKDGGTHARWELNSSIKLAGVTVATPKCERSGGDHYCETNKPTFSKSFFKVSASYPISIVTLTVSGEAVGKVALNSKAHKKFTNDSSTMKDAISSYVSSSAGVDGRASVSAGIPWLASGGVTTFVDILDGKIKNDSDNARIEYKNNSNSKKVRYKGVTQASASATIGGGKVELWVKLVGIKAANKVIASWGGKKVADKSLYKSSQDEYFSL